MERQAESSRRPVLRKVPNEDARGAGGGAPEPVRWCRGSDPVPHPVPRGAPLDKQSGAGGLGRKPRVSHSPRRGQERGTGRRKARSHSAGQSKGDDQEGGREENNRGVG